MSTSSDQRTRTLPAAPPAFSDAEFARRRTAVDELSGQRDLDVVVAYGANRFGSAIAWLTDWQVTREAVVVCRRERRPVLFVGFPNHVPNARRVARDADVRSCDERTTDTIADELDRGGPVRRIGVVGPLPRTMRAALAARGEVVEVDSRYVELRASKSPEELAALRHAAALTDASAAALVSAAVPGTTELDLVAAVEGAYAGTGGTNHIHYVSTTSMTAPDRCVPGQWPTARRVEIGSAVTFELSTAWGQDYPGQLLRTVTVGADPTPLYRDLHAAADAALESMRSLLRPGVLPVELVAAASLITDAGFTTVDDLVHGLGGGYLPPVLTQRHAPSGRDLVPLEEGMTLVVQPNVCTSDLTAGVQTGEMFEITSTGARSLHDFPTGLLRGGV